MGQKLTLPVAVLALALGLGIGWYVRGAAATPTTPPDVDRAFDVERAPDERESGDEELVAPGPRTAPSVEGRDAGDRRTAGGETQAVGLFSAPLMEHAEKGIVQGWKQERSDDPTDEELVEGLDSFQGTTLTLPMAIGMRLARRRTESERAIEDIARGGLMDLLGRLESGEASGPYFDLVGDRAAFDQSFVAKSTGPALNATTALSQRELQNSEPVVDGSTLQFPAGVFALQEFGRYWDKRFPRDLTVRGAGKAATLLVLQSDVSADDVVHNLSFERCTVYTNGNYMFDVRDPSMSLTLREVRVTGFDKGSGSSCVFGTEALALRAIDCEFLGGYGRSPRSGQLFDVRHDGLLARFERCVVERTNPFHSIGGGATVVFASCDLRDVWTHGTRVPDNVRLDGTTLGWLDGQPGDELKRDLNDLFPGWKEDLRR
ncbi:MAG: hypothetical protein AAF726_03970 [Planctomycetota bacterium]